MPGVQDEADEADEVDVVLIHDPLWSVLFSSIVFWSGLLSF